jgi:hypothetical protein
MLFAGVLLVMHTATVVHGEEIVRRSRYERAELAETYTDTTDEAQMQSLRNKYGIPVDADLECPSGGHEVVVVIYRHNLKMGQGMAMPIEDTPAFFVPRKPEKFYSLHWNEPVRIGEHVYSFRNTGTSLIVNYVHGGEVSGKEVSEGNAWITADGYMFQRWEAKAK